jgi:ribose transport system ATP-binding protein
MLADFTLRENLTVPRIESRRGVIPLRAEREEAGKWLERLGVRPPLPQAKISTLSGGNQQKVILARILRLEPKVIVLHEPTQGVDVGAKAEIHELLDRALLDGAALIVCSSDPDELVRLCGSVIVMRDGREAARLENSAVESHRITDLQLRGR